MLIPFDDMKDESRVWIYTSKTPFSNSELNEIESRVSVFVENWTSHGNPVTASYAIMYDHFLILAADESQDVTGGCSIDSSFKLVKQLENDLSLSLLDRQLMSFMIDNKVVQVPLTNLNQELKSFKDVDNKIFFNNLVKNLGELKSSWLARPKETWIKNYL